MNARLAVVIPSYNHAAFIGNAIDSVLGQTRPPDRFLVVDDGSTDDSAARVEAYRDRGVELVVQANAGAHAALNRAIGAVAGDCALVAILNSDDVYEPRRLECCGHRLAERPDLDVVSSALRVIDAEGEPCPADDPGARWMEMAWSIGDDGGLDLPAWLGNANFPATTSNIVARSDYLAAHPFQAYRYCHDYHLLAGAAVRGRLAVLGEPLLRYRRHGANTMGMDPKPLVRELLQMQLDLYASLRDALREDAETRTRFASFARASWDNFSSFDAGLFQVALAEALAELGPARVEALAGALLERDLPELSRTPNGPLQKADLGRGAAIPRSELLAGNERMAAVVQEQIRYHAALLGSRWVALGQLLGVCGELLPNVTGGAPSERLDALRERARHSRWLQLGARLRVASARRILERSG